MTVFTGNVRKLHSNHSRQYDTFISFFIVRHFDFYNLNS